MSGLLTQVERVSILEGLSSTDAEVRRLSTEQLLKLPVREALPHLVECLGDADWRVRKSAVERFVSCREVEAVSECLIDALSDGENSGRRNAAFEALVGLGLGASRYLVAALPSPDVDVRKLVVDALAAIGDPETCGPLLATLEDSDPNVRAAVAEAVGVVGSSAEASNLLQVATNEDEETLVRLSALRALSCLEADTEAVSVEGVLPSALLRPAVFQLLGHSQDPRAREILLKGLSETKRTSREAAMGALLRCYADETPDGADELSRMLRRAAAADESVIEFACERLEMADLPSRLMLVQFLGLLGDPRAVLPVLLAGRDEAMTELTDETLSTFGATISDALAPAWEGLEYDLKIRACSLLGRVGGQQSEMLLVKALDSSDGELRCAAAMALGSGGFFERLPDLVRCLEVAAESEASDLADEVPAIVSALAALAERAEHSGSATSAQIVEMLLSRLGGASFSVRLAIATVLARVGRAQDEDVIGYLLKDASPEVRRSAVQAMARFDFESARDSLRLALGDESGMVRTAAAQVLGTACHPAAMEDLVRLLQDRDDEVVSVAVHGLGRLAAEIAGPREEVLSQIAPTLVATPVVALAGIEALMLVGGEKAAELALMLLDRGEPELVRAALGVIGLHGRSDSLLEATALVAHPDWAIRGEIARLLGDRSVKKGLPALLRRLEVEQDTFVREAILSAIRKLED
ncbi:MAG: HEAT repeat domain-containing protein [Myxococcota bacterium]